MSHMKDLHREMTVTFHGIEEVVVMTEEEELDMMDKQEWFNSTH